jgi:hypothetical protein
MFALVFSLRFSKVAPCGWSRLIVSLFSFSCVNVSNILVELMVDPVTEPTFAFPADVTEGAVLLFFVSCISDDVCVGGTELLKGSFDESLSQTLRDVVAGTSAGTFCFHCDGT